MKKKKLSEGKPLDTSRAKRSESENKECTRQKKKSTTCWQGAKGK